MHKNCGNSQGSDDLETIRELARQKLLLDQQAKTMDERRKTLRDRMVDALREYGTPDLHGNPHLGLGADVPVGDKVATGIYLRRSASHRFDEDAAYALAERKGILDQVLRTETHTYVDQDALWGCQQRGLVTADEIDALITTTYTDSLWGTYR